MRQDDFERGMEKEQIVMREMETILKMLEALVNSSKYSNQQKDGFKALLKYAREGGEIRCEVVSREGFEVLRNLLEEHGIAYGATVFPDREGEERVNVMYKAEDENWMATVRTEFVKEMAERFSERTREQIKEGGRTENRDESEARFASEAGPVTDVESVSEVGPVSGDRTVSEDRTYQRSVTEDIER